MASFQEDEWRATLAASDEFSLDNPVNISSRPRDRLVPLDRNNPNFAEVQKLFVKGWRHRKKARPVIRHIFKVLWPEHVLEPFLDYRDRVQTTLEAKDKRRNERLLFHGTNRACLVGESSTSILLCGLERCYLCSIVRNSFDVSRCGSKNPFMRFGVGIYTTSCSSKADDYVSNLSGSASLRVMILSRVVVGKPCKISRTTRDLIEPPPGYDSIAGEPGKDLNFEETVTYDNDSVRPAYLVVYGDRPPLVSNLKEFARVMFKTPIVGDNDSVRPAYLAAYGGTLRPVSNLKEFARTMFRTSIAP